MELMVRKREPLVWGVDCFFYSSFFDVGNLCAAVLLVFASGNLGWAGLGFHGLVGFL